MTRLEKFQDERFWLKSGIVGLLLLSLLNSLGSTTADWDLWGYLAFGRLFWESKGFPYQDIFSYVPTRNPWIYHEWLTGVIYYPIYQTLGAPALQLLKYVFGLGTTGLIYLTARKRGADPLSSVLFLWGAQLFLAIGYSPVRAQVYSYGFYALYLYMLESARLTGGYRGLWLLVPIQVLWCNLHGGFVAGLGLLALYALGEALSRRPFWPYLLILLLSSLATLINPYGLAYWSYIFQAVTMPRPEIPEWFSFYKIWKSSLPKEPIIYFLAIMFFSVSLVVWAKWREITAGLALAVTMYLALKHIRLVVFFLLLAGAYLPLLLTAYLETMKRSYPSLKAVLQGLGWKVPSLVMTLLIVGLGYKFIGKDPLSLKIPAYPRVEVGGVGYYPVGAVDYIRKQHLAGKVLADFRWGEYVIWTLYPQCRVAFDGRYETVYPKAVADKYFDFLAGRANWRQFLEDYPPDLVLLDTDSRVYPLMLGEAGWRLVYGDSGCALFQKEASEPVGQ